MAPPFDTIADPTRRRILDRLRQGPCLVGELAGDLGLSQPGTSKHLRVLREAGFVAVRPEGQRRRYELRPEPLAEIDAWLAPYRWMWADRLDRLGRQLDAMPDAVPGETPGGPAATSPPIPDPPEETDDR